MKADILIVDDEADIRGLIQGILEDEGYATRQASSSREAYEQVGQSVPGLVILDIWLENSDDDGMAVLEKLKEDHPFLPVLMISGHGTIETAVSAIKRGAYDFIEKPFKSGRLLLMIERALENAQLRRENATLRQKTEGVVELIGNSQSINTLSHTIGKLAQTNSRVLLTGEPGSGKEVVAKVIHRISQRGHGPFMAVNCAILRPDRLEVELFGSERGILGEPAKTGMLERASGGTLLLDEVSDMPLETQGKIVRVLQEQKFQRVGGRETISVDVRIIASTNRDLKSLIRQGKFREDLFYRLNVVPLEIPPLRSRAQDIPLLIDHFSALFSRQAGIPPCIFSQSCIIALQSYEWPGNVRQLRNVVEWVMIMYGNTDKEIVEPEDLPPEISRIELANAGGGVSSDLTAVSLREAREIFERNYLLTQINRFEGNISRTAQFVGMERSALHRKLKQLGISDLAKQNGDEKESLADDERKIA